MVLRSIAVAGLIIGILSHTLASSQNTGGAAGTWRAEGMPWTLELDVERTKLTGTVDQDGDGVDPAVILDGRIDGQTVTFKAASAGGDRTITFTGTINGDEIAFTRAVQVREGGAGGGRGLFGALGPAQFTVRRAGQVPVLGQNTGGSTLPAFSSWSTFCDGVEHTTSIALGDLDNDGDLDLIFGNGRHLEEIDWVFSNNGYGGFYAKRALGTEADPTYGVALGDLDGDGALDVVVANDVGDPAVSYRNDGKGNFTWLGNVGRVTVARRAVALGDLDGDGDLDVILVGLAQDHIYLNENRGLQWTERPLGAREGAGSRATSVAVGDVDGDKDLDIVLPGRYQAPSNVHLNDGKAGFAEARPFGAPVDDTTAVALADVDGDRDLDIVTANWEAPHAIYVNDGRGGFTSHATFGTGRERAWSVALADMDLDGDLDAVVGNANADYWAQDGNGDARNDLEGHRPLDLPSRIYLNDGRGRMTSGPAVAFGHDNTRPIALGDVDRDGDTDIVMGNDCQPNHVFYNPIRSARRPTP